MMGFINGFWRWLLRRGIRYDADGGREPAGNVRVLSHGQARRCEEAIRPTCRCRCLGAYHGARRGPVEELPSKDPHFPGRRCGRCGGTGLEGDGLLYEFPCADCNGDGWILKKPKAKAAR